MPNWFLNHFAHPGYAWSWAAAALVAAPIIIHLINRLRYRRVKFAAMEFLLASEQKNRRRILIEQLLLLLARILLILLVISLISRFTSDSNMLNLFQEAKAHHVVLLDDSGSMRDRTGEESAFERAKKIALKIATEGERQTGLHKFTLILLSRPDETVGGLSERPLTNQFLADLGTYLEDLDATVLRLPLAQGLDAARERLTDDQSSTKYLHVISDYRGIDWIEDKATTAALRHLDQSDVTVNLVRTVPDTHENLAITKLTGELQSAAQDIPVEINVEVTNFGTRAAKDLRLSVRADEVTLPLTLELNALAPGESATLDFYTVFEQADRHTLAVSLPEDAVDQDNTRFLALDIPEEIPVLIIDGTPDRSQAQYVADAIATNPRVTGIGTVIEGPDYLRRYPLDGFQSIFLINVPSLPEDGVDALEKYAARGGGLAWFLGDLVSPKFYNDRLYREGAGIFPVRLANTYQVLDHDSDQEAPRDIIPSDHPVLKILTLADSPFLDLVRINGWYPVEPDWQRDPASRPPGYREIATLRNRAPLIVEQTYGELRSRIVALLTSAGPLRLPDAPDRDKMNWHNWADGEGVNISYPVFQLELQRYIARRDRLPPMQTAGEPIVRTFSPADYLPEVEITSPDNRMTEITATPPESGSDSATVLLRAEYRDTETPGVYTIRMTPQSGPEDVSLIAVNVDPQEGNLAVAPSEQILRQLPDHTRITIREFGAEDWLRADAPGNDMKLLLLVALLLLLVVEQYLSYRFSYHSRPTPPVAQPA